MYRGLFFSYEAQTGFPVSPPESTSDVAFSNRPRLPRAGPRFLAMVVAFLRPATRNSRLVILGGLLFLALGGFVEAAVEDPIDVWAPVDITALSARIEDDALVVNLQFRESLYNYVRSYPVIEIFVDSDKDVATGDYRSGAVAGVDHIIKCVGGIGMNCTLHRLPSVPSEEVQSLNFGLIPGASATLPTPTTMTLRLPGSAIGGATSVDLFAVAYLQGNNAVVSGRLLSGNGDRCPDDGVLDTATGKAVVRRPGAPVDVSLAVERNAEWAAYEIVGARFRTFGDQFEITLTYNRAIDLGGFDALRGGIIIDSDRSLHTGQLRMIPPQGLGLEIPSWGGDVELSYWLDDRQTILSFRLQYETNYGTLFYMPIPFGTPCEQDVRLSGILACNDGGWRVQGEQLIMTGSLSLLDAVEQSFTPASNTSTFVRRPSDGRVILRAYTIDEATGEKDVTPDLGRSWDTGTGAVLEPLVWDSARMVSAADPLDHGGQPGIDLIRVDAQITQGKLVVKGVLSYWSDVDSSAYFEVLLDTDMNVFTGERVTNDFVPGLPMIGADYLVRIWVVYDGVMMFLFTELVRPDGTTERHDAFLLAEPNNIHSPEKEDAFTVSIPLESLGSPEELALFVATRRWLLVLTERYDIAPPDPIVVRSTDTPVPTVFQTTAGTISWFYAAAFNRTPIPNSALPNYGDIGGLAFWTQAYLTGAGGLAAYRNNVYAIADFFVGSDEFQAQYPASLTNEQFVTALYDNMLGRAADAGGLAFWVGRLNSGVSRGAVLADFTNSDENRNANPLRRRALESFIAFTDADGDQVITPEEAAVWLAQNPDLDGAVVDGN